MRQGILRGETLDQLRDRILPKIDMRKVAPGARPMIVTARRNAEALVRTSTMTVANDAHFAAYDANADIMEGFEWSATLDKRTCAVCAAMDGLRWDLHDQPIGHSRPFPGMPLHWNDRCSPLPITRSWEQLAQEAGGNTKLARDLDKIPRGERASMDGPVSGDTTYEGWFADQDPSRQLEILGPGRFALYQKGNLGIADMVSGQGAPLTLKELAAKVR
jgi:SPP1 gp7 family putative phage head morphogenesis protein